MSETKWIAVDWGTTNLRAWVFSTDNQLLNSLSSHDGMRGLSPDTFEPALLSLIEAYLPTTKSIPIIACGMVGAKQGWMEAPYVEAPCWPSCLDQAVKVETLDQRMDVLILPGIKQTTPADVMRGEETQIAGFLSHNPSFRGVICLPGTHTKWVKVNAGKIINFQTFMSGELFDLISQHSVLRYSLSDDGWNDEAFIEALNEATILPESLPAHLFALRAESLLNNTRAISNRARLSGLLIGLELAGSRIHWAGRKVTIIGSDTLSIPYEKALTQQGISVNRCNGEAMTLAGLSMAYKLWELKSA